ncbi:MAG: FKBP-type peptidyl-prolyl cis-trans isomerase [Planctomycetota bacterium]|jgi:FKBP-type peptidyl-prolyl cis-trans isomerase SlyD
MSTNKLSSVQDGAVVSIYYTLTNDAGEVLDTNRKGGAPLAYLHGHSNIVPGLEKALTGAETGAKVVAVVTPEEGYGQPNDELFQEVPRSAFPEGMELAEGVMVHGKQPDGQPVQARIAKIGEETVTLDHNHPLAGATLHFEVTVDKIREATDEEKQHGHAHGQGGHQH